MGRNGNAAPPAAGTNPSVAAPNAAPSAVAVGKSQFFVEHPTGSAARGGTSTSRYQLRYRGYRRTRGL